MTRIDLARASDLGSGIPSGTSFPGSPSDNDLFHRTDLDLLFFFNGTRWLSLELGRLHVAPYASETTRILTVATNSYAKVGVPFLAGCSDIWIEDFSTSFYISTGGTALSGSHLWTVALKASRDATNNTLDTIAVNTINSGSSAVNRRITATVDALLDNGTVHDWFQIDVGKTGTPGNLQAYSEITYRMVAT